MPEQTDSPNAGHGPTDPVRVLAGCVGRRVMVRRVLPGERGPSGGPAMTDVLGELEAYDGTHLTVRTAAGDLVEIAARDVVAGKPVPPRPARRTRAPGA